MTEGDPRAWLSAQPQAVLSPTQDSLLEEDFPDTQRILTVK